MEQDEREQQFQQIKSDIHRQVIGKIDLSLIGTMNEGDLRFEIRRASEKILEERSYLLNVEDRERLVNEVIDETFGLGPLEPLFRDPTITDILINGAKTVYVERRGRLEKTRISFANDAASHQDHPADRQRRRPPHRRDDAHGRRPARGRQPRQRDHSAAGPGWAAGVDPPLRRSSAYATRT